MTHLRFTLIFILTLLTAFSIGLLSAKAQSEFAQRVTLDQPFTLHIGEWALLHDSPERFAVQLTGLVSDSRCPADVDCIVVGQAIFTAQLSRNDVIEDAIFTIGQYSVAGQNLIRHAGYVVEMVTVEPPAPKHTETLKLADYAVTLVIHTDKTQPAPAPTATPTPDAAPTPISSAADELLAALDQPFTLCVGQTAHWEDADFSLTLRSVADGSGCLTADDCSVMTAEGSLVLRREDETLLLELNVSFAPEMGCGYVPRSQPSPADLGFIMSDASRGVLLQRLAREELTNTLQDIADTVSEGSSQPNKAAQNLYKTLLRIGKTAQAVPLLAKGAKDWEVEKLTEVDGAAIFLWRRANDRRVAALLKLGQADSGILVVASLEDNRQRAEVQAALIALAARIE